MSLADQIAALSKRITDVRGIVPSYEWATVASVSPPTVILDSDVTNTPRPVADVLVANLAVADRVEVRAIGSRRDVIARAGGAPAAATAATPDTLILRDASGRAKVADPSEPDDIDTMGARDAAIAAIPRVRGQIPSSVVVGSGSASVAADGTITFTECSSVSLNGVFDGLGADLYEITTWVLRTSGAVIAHRLRVGGVDAAGASYAYTATYSRLSSGPSRASSSNADSFGFLAPTAAGGAADAFGVLSIGRPGTTDITLYTMHSSSTPNNDRCEWSEAGNSLTTAYDGITLFVSTGTITGSMKVVKIA